MNLMNLHSRIKQRLWFWYLTDLIKLVSDNPVDPRIRAVRRLYEKIV